MRRWEMGKPSRMGTLIVERMESGVEVSFKKSLPRERWSRPREHGSLACLNSSLMIDWVDHQCDRIFYYLRVGLDADVVPRCPSAQFLSYPRKRELLKSRELTVKFCFEQKVKAPHSTGRWLSRDSSIEASMHKKYDPCRHRPYERLNYRLDARSDPALLPIKS